MSQHVRNGGDVVVETLTSLGVTHVFGIPGQHALGLFDAIRRSDLEFMSSRVENNSAFGADGYARVTGKVAVMFVSTGPGALTSLGALQEPFITGVPVLVISSQVPRRGIGGRKNGLLHQVDDQQKSAQNVVKSTAVVLDAAHIPTAIADAWAFAQTVPAGPTWVEIPQDVLLEPAPLPPVSSTVVSIPARPARAELAEEAARLLSGAERPVILAGGGVRRSETGSKQLLRVAEAIGAPVVSTAGGKGAISFGHPLSAGSWIEDRYTTELLEEADVLLAVGTTIGEVTSNYFTFAPKGRLIQVDAEPRALGSNYSGLGIHGDAGLTLEAIADRLPMGSEAAREQGAQVAADLRARVEQRLAAQDLETELALMHALRDAVPDDAHTFWDMTIAAYWAWSAWDPRDGEFHSAQGAGGLGFAFPAALAAAAGSGRRTLAVSGDGGAMYSIAELATARQHGADVTWLIIDDGGYGILREYMEGAFGQATATELARPDFAALARAFGVPAHVATVDNVGEVVARTFAEPGPAVVVLPALLRMFAPTHLDGHLD
ncbi:thiamine pyrophosphate-binding protein [Nocardioides panacihumi]|uniref:Thiamine pyrophosphate-binding protein n=1 Tax=Nocardioides panacihumi TaxID=400774 RepID=A0ABN2RW15_9ACTN